LTTSFDNTKVLQESWFALQMARSANVSDLQAEIPAINNQAISMTQELSRRQASEVMLLDELIKRENDAKRSARKAEQEKRTERMTYQRTEFLQRVISGEERALKKLDTTTLESVDRT
jgi:hypothetical protein